MPELNIRQEAAQRYAVLRQRMAERLAQRLIPPPDSERANRQTMLDAWRFRSPGLDDDQAYWGKVQELRSQGVGEEDLLDQVHPKRRQLIELIGGPDDTKRVKFAQEMAAMDTPLPPVTDPTTGGY